MSDILASPVSSMFSGVSGCDMDWTPDWLKFLSRNTCPMLLGLRIQVENMHPEDLCSLWLLYAPLTELSPLLFCIQCWGSGPFVLTPHALCAHRPPASKNWTKCWSGSPPCAFRMIGDPWSTSTPCTSPTVTRMACTTSNKSV